MADFDSLVDLLQRARARPDALAIRFLVDGEEEEVAWTYARLDARARAVGAALRARGAAGKRALLLYAPGLDYVAAFFGCLYAKVIAVPAFPPDPSRLPRTLPRLRAIVADCQAELALTTEAIQDSRGAFRDALEPPGPPLVWLATDALGDSGEPGDAVAREDVAFLQYTSGSTASPRGVVITHGNLLHNLRATQRAAGRWSARASSAGCRPTTTWGSSAAS